MRFETLLLEDWGHFRQTPLSLPEGGQGLQVVYGPNEAGKSTLLRAFTAALFGVDNRSRDGDVERYRALGATASTAAGPLAWRRVRQPGRAPADPALARLAELTGSVDRARWRRVFGFSDRDLADGAASLTERPLAQALDSSVDPERAKARLEEAATALYGPRQQKKGRVLELGAELDRIKARQQEVRLSPAAWHTMNQAAADAVADLARRRHERDQADRRAGRLKRQCGARELLTLRDRLRAELAQAPPADGVSPLAAADYRRLLGKLGDEERALRAAEGAVRTQAEAAAAIRVEEDLRARASVIQGLTGGLQRLRDVALRLPVRQEQARGTEENLRRETVAFLPHVPLEEVPARAPGTHVLDRIRVLADARKAALTARDARSVERAHTASRLADAQQQYDQTVVPPWSPALADALHEASDPTRVEALARLTAEREQRTDDAQRYRLELRTVAVSGDVAATIPSLPPATWSTAWGEERRRLLGLTDTIRLRLTAARAQVADLTTAIAATDATRRLPSVDDLRAARDRRDRGWGRIRQGLLEAGFIPRLEVVTVADQHEEATQAADDVADTLRDEAQAVAERARRVAELEVGSGTVAREHAELVAAEAAVASHEAVWQAAWVSHGVSPLDAASMAGWTERCRAWARAEDERAAVAERHAVAAGVVDAATEALRSALGAVGLSTTGGRAVLVARAVEAQHAHQSGLSLAQERLDALPALRAHHHRAVEAAARAEAAYTEADSAWKAALVAAGASPEDTDAERLKWPDNVAARVKEIRQWIDGRAAVDAEAQAVVALRTEIRVALAPLGGVPAGGEFEALDDVARRVRAAEQAHVELDRIRAVLRERETSRDECRKRRDTLVAELAAHRAGRTEAEWLPHADAVARAAEARVKLADVERELDAHRAGDDPEAFDAEAVALDAEALRRHAEDAARDAAQAGKDYDDANQAVGSTRTELDRIRPERTAADLIEEELAVRTELRAAIAEWVTIRLARKLLDVAIAEREKDHLPQVVAHASTLFAAITGGRYRGIEERRGTLVAHRADGAVLDPEELSDATRQQVFLAARLAWAELHNRSHEPLPLILDDVLAAFDETRAAVTMDALRTFAEGQQVVLLTHHAYIRDIAAGRAGVHVTTLPPPG